MTVLQRTDLTTSQKIQCAAAAVAGQHAHGSKTALSETYEISRPTVYAVGAAAESEHSNLIALCRNCHVRADRGEIDRKSLKFYKSNSRTSHDRFSQLEIDVLFEANASRSESIKWPPYMKLLIKRICDAGLVALVQPNRDVSIGGMRADPDDLCITEKGRKYIRGLGSSELSPFLGRRSEELLRLASVEYYSSNRQAATRLRPITAGYTWAKISPPFHVVGREIQPSRARFASDNTTSVLGSTNSF